MRASITILAYEPLDRVLEPLFDENSNLPLMNTYLSQMVSRQIRFARLGSTHAFRLDTYSHV